MFEREESAEKGKIEEKDKEFSEANAVDEREVTNDSNELDELERGFKSERDELIQAKPRSIDMPIPSELDNYIQKGLAKGIKAQKAGRFRKWSALVACCLLATLITTVRVSPAVAAVLHQIPGLGYIVELINYDKGLQSAVENDFIQPLGISDEHENVIFTVDGIIMDESSLVIFYTVENKRGRGVVDFPEVELFDEMGKPLKDVAIGSYSAGDLDPDGDGKVHSQFNVNFSDHTVIPNRLSLKVKLGVKIKPPENLKPSEQSQANHPESSTQLPSTWEVTIPVDKDKFAGLKTVYEVNQSVVIEGQKITFEKVTVFPTRMILNVSYDPANSKKIFAFDDLTLVNEKGEVWGRIMNGMSGSRLDENHEVLFFQSNYFTQPKKLFLRGKSIRALDKKDTRVTLDLENKRILTGPPNIILDQVIMAPSGMVTELYFLLKTNLEYDRERGFSIFNFAFTDAGGKSFNARSQSSRPHSEKQGYDQTIVLELRDDAFYRSPITLQIQDYPSRIIGEFNIPIK